MSHQAFGILPKIREVDQFMTPEVQETVREVHPEVCFYGLTGHPMRHKKKSADGKAERLRVLQDEFSGIERALSMFPRRQVASDDVLRIRGSVDRTTHRRERCQAHPRTPSDGRQGSPDGDVVLEPCLRWGAARKEHQTLPGSGLLSSNGANYLSGSLVICAA